MPANNFKLFDQNKANLLSDTEYANATQRLNGVQTGVASSQLNNKFAYQVSLVAYAIAQIMNQNGLDASDTLAVSAFVGNLGGSLLQKVADRASSAEAAAGVLANKYISPATMKAAALLLSGGVMNGTLNMNNNKITNLPSPSTPSEPATKEYVDGSQTFKVKTIYENASMKNVTSQTDFMINCTKEEFFNIKFLEVILTGVKLYDVAYIKFFGNNESSSSDIYPVYFNKSNQSYTIDKNTIMLMFDSTGYQRGAELFYRNVIIRKSGNNYISYETYNITSNFGIKINGYF